MSDNDKQNKELTILDAIVNNKELVTTEDKKVPLSMVLATVLLVTLKVLVVRAYWKIP